MMRTITAALCLLPTIALAEEFTVDPGVGNNTMTAVFDAKLGERITALSSQVECTATFDEKAGTASGTCSLPLKSIRVDNDDTKSEHFSQWATNKKSDPKDCRFEAKITNARLAGPLVAEQPVAFTGDATFTVCGRKRSDGGSEHVMGTAILFPAGSYGSQKTVRVRAKIEKFNRDSYRIGPKYTEGWFARVQSLAKVVAEEGTIELNLFAKAKK